MSTKINKNDIDINFLAAKSIGAKFVLSTFKIKKKELISRCEPCYDSKNFYLYEIQEWKILKKIKF